MPLSLRPTVVAMSGSRLRTAPLMPQNLKASEGGDLKPLSLLVQVEFRFHDHVFGVAAEAEAEAFAYALHGSVV